MFLRRLKANSTILATNSIKTFSTSKLYAVKPKVKVEYTDLFINGKFVPASENHRMATIDPRSGEVITHVAEAQEKDIQLAVKAARNAFDNGAWPKMSGASRGKILNKIADLVEKNLNTLAELETWDNGKPLAAAKGDMALVADHFRYYAGWADKIGGKTIAVNDMFGKHFAHTHREPIGVVGAIIPWNFPLLMFAWQAAPALSVGCTIVVKPAESTPLTALFFAKLLAEAGVPEGVVNVVPGIGECAGAALASHPDVDKISFTGETTTGKLVMKAAADNLKPVTLELGGKSPSIVMDDADIDNAVEAHQVGLFLNQGQCCCASSRIYVQKGVYDEFVKKTVAKTRNRRVGDPFTDVDQGPQQNEQQYSKVMDYIQKGKNEGATLLSGGKALGDKGYYVEPTIFGDVKDNMCISREEIFGPVMQISTFSTTEEVLKRANDTRYGLAAGVFTSNINTANYLSRALKAGTVWINCYDVLVASLPFGGYKHSGFGRINGEYALDNFTHTKCIVQKLPNDGGWYH